MVSTLPSMDPTLTDLSPDHLLPEDIAAYEADSSDEDPPGSWERKVLSHAPTVDPKDVLKDRMDGFCYLVPYERFSYRRFGAWVETELVGKEGIINHLISEGWDPEEAAKTVASRKYSKAYGFGMFPQGPDVYMDGDGKTMLNTWAPPRLAPLEGPYPTIERILDHLVDGDEEGGLWLVNWLAAKIQDPLLVPKVAVVLSTSHGAGKGILASVIRAMLGERNTAVITRAELENQFNLRWAGKLFVFADEVINSDNMISISEKLKVLIDGSEIESQGKGTNQRSIPNRSAWLFASNDKISPVAVEKGDRRYSVFSNHSELEPEYVALLNGCYEPDRKTPTPAFKAEMAGFFHELKTFEVDRRLLSRPYTNAAREALIEASLPSHELFCRMVDEGGLDEILEVLQARDYRLQQSRPEWMFELTKPDGSMDRAVATAVLYQAYVEFCKRSGSRSLKVNRFGVALRNHTPAWTSTRPTVPGTNRRVSAYVVPARRME